MGNTGEKKRSKAAGKWEYFPWVDSNDESYACIAELIPSKLDDLGNLFNGNNQSLAHCFPKKVVFDLSKKHGGSKIGDFVRNTDHMLIVSERLKEILERNSDDFEFYRVSIRDHKRRIVKEPYYFAHLLLAVQCLDKRRSEFVASHMEPDQMLYISRLVLNEKKLPKNKKIFRLGEMKSLIMVRKDLGIEIYRENECRGMLFLKIESYGEEFRDS